MTFSDPKVGEALAKDFVCAWKNRKDGFHNCDPTTEAGIFKGSADAFPTRNIITMFLTPDLQVVHYFSGYFSPALFAKQVDFARAARDAVFDKSFKVKKGAKDAFVKLHGDSYDALKKEAEALAKKRDAWKEATADLGSYEYDGQKHEHNPACLWVMNSVDSYLSLVHGELAKNKDIEKQVAQVSLAMNDCCERGGFSSLMREAREVKKEPGERKIVDGLPGLSEVEGKYLYGNPFTEE